jgi:hypothetical protein
MTKDSILYKAKREKGISIRFHHSSEMWENANQLLNDGKIRLFRKLEDGAILKSTI